MTEPADLVEDVARAIDGGWPPLPGDDRSVGWQDWRREAASAIAAVRAYDAGQPERAAQSFCSGCGRDLR